MNQNGHYEDLKDGSGRAVWVTDKPTREEWCNKCKDFTPQIKLNDGENFDTECTKCHTKNFHIQGFNANLM